MKDLDGEFRMIISHAFLGCDTSDISKETWDLAISECVNYAKSLIPSTQEQSEDRGCPCKYLDEPCRPNCTCVNGFSSSGCHYCARYGSLEQRKEMAKKIAGWIKSGMDQEQSGDAEIVIEDMKDSRKYTYKTPNGYTIMISCLKNENKGDLIISVFEDRETLFQIVLPFSDFYSIFKPDNKGVDSPPQWYRKDHIYSHLKQHGYSDQIAEELSQEWADNCQGAFKKGWEMGRNKDKDPNTAYQYLQIVKGGEDQGYWKERCLAAESFIEFSPIDPDINGLQIEAHKKWLQLKNKSNG